MSKILIVTEGKDLYFIDAYLDKFKHLHNGIDRSDIFDLIYTGGCTKLKEVQKQMQENSAFDGVNMVIFDADDPSKPDGGKANKLNYLNREKTKLQIEFETFLLPNNQDDGDFETLLTNIASSKHNHLFECFKKYTDCVKSKINPEVKPPIYNAPVEKSKIYAYVDTIRKSKKDRARFKKDTTKGIELKYDKETDFLFDNPEIWNLDDDYLDNLKDFLTKHITAFIQKKGQVSTNP